MLLSKRVGGNNVGFFFTFLLLCLHSQGNSMSPVGTSQGLEQAGETLPREVVSGELGLSHTFSRAAFICVLCGSARRRASPMNSPSVQEQM